MQVNLNCNTSNPQFGMALRSLSSSSTEFNRYSRHLGLENPINIRGLQQFAKEQAKNKLFDVVYLEKGQNGWNPSFDVIENATGKSVYSAPIAKGITGLDHYGIVKYPFRKIFARLFNPKQELPYGMLIAGEKATELEKEALKTQKWKNLFDYMFSEKKPH